MQNAVRGFSLVDTLQVLVVGGFQNRFDVLFKIQLDLRCAVIKGKRIHFILTHHDVDCIVQTVVICIFDNTEIPE